MIDNSAPHRGPGMKLEPANDLVASAGSAKRWKSTGPDPQFRVELPGGRLEAGWYEVTCDLEAVDGAGLSAVLYPDFGTPVLESDGIPLFGAATRTRTSIIVLKRDIVGLRFDPLSSEAEFDLELFTLTKVGRFHAAREMWSAITQRSGVVMSRKRLIRRCAYQLFRNGPRAVGQALYALYLDIVAISLSRNYLNWVLTNDTWTPARLEEIRASFRGREDAPSISVVMPVYNPPEKWLRRCIDSVIEQSYEAWTLCIADDCSPNPRIRSVLSEYAARDPRIKVVFREKNGHISRSSNSALELVTGDYVALLDHDDELSPVALSTMAKAIMDNPDAQVLYSDEDKIGEDGIRFDPYFKPDFNIDLFRGHNMVSHFGVYRTALLRELGGFREGYEGSQDYDLALRCVERLSPSQIVHVPHVLYHWRTIAGSTAAGPQEKSYAGVAAKKSLTAHFERVGIRGRFEELSSFPGNFAHTIEPGDVPLVSIIIPTRDRVDLLKQCVESILEKTTYARYEVLIVDNGSVEQETLDYFEGLTVANRAKVLRYDAPFNFSAINNFAVGQAAGTVLVFANNDLEVISSGWLDELVSHALRKEVGAVGCMLYYPNDTVQHAGIILGLGQARIAGHAYHLQQRGYPGQMCRMHLTQQLSAVTAACMAVRREVFDEVGGFDEALGVAFNDVDLCLRIRAKGYAVVWTPRAEMYHHESASRGHDDVGARKERFDAESAFMASRWGAELLNDPYFNANLSLDDASFMFGPKRHVRQWQAGA